MDRQYYWKSCIAAAVAGIVGAVAASWAFHAFYSLPFSFDALIVAFACVVIVAAVVLLVLLPLFRKRGTSEEEKSVSNQAVPDDSETLRRLSEMAAERDSINEIIDHMAFGFVMFAPGGKILAANRSAIRFLNAPDQDYAGADVSALVPDESFRSAVIDTLKGNNSVGNIESGNYSCRYSLDPVRNGKAVVGATFTLINIVS